MKPRTIFATWTSVVFTLVSMMLLTPADVAVGQGILKNGGTFTNSGTATYKEIQNYKTTEGTIINSGTLNTTTSGGGSGNLLNQDGGGLDGTVRNFNGASHGTIVVVTNLNNNSATAVFDNDNAGVGTFRIGGAITNAGTFDTDSGRVDYNASGAQSIIATTYGALVASGSGAKTLAGPATVNDSARIDAASMAVSTSTLTMKGSTFTLQNSGTLSAASGTVDYAGNWNQQVISTTYGNLTLSGSTSVHTKSAAGNVTLSASGALTLGNDDTLYVAGNLDLSGSGVTLTNNEAIKVGGDVTFVGTITSAGSFYYAGSSAQNIGANTYSDLRLGGDGAKNFPSGTVAVTGNYGVEVASGSRSYGTGTFSFAGTTGTQAISGLSETFYILDFSGGAAKTLAGTSLGASRFDISSASGQVTNNITTVTLTNISNVSLTVASGTTLVNNQTLSMNGDFENSGTVENNGTISVY